MHRNHMIKNSIYFITENLFIKYEIEPNTNFVKKAEKVHEVVNLKK